MSDRLEEIKRSHNAGSFGTRQWAPGDIAWLIAEVERLRVAESILHGALTEMLRMFGGLDKSKAYKNALDGALRALTESETNRG